MDAILIAGLVNHYFRSGTHRVYHADNLCVHALIAHRDSVNLLEFGAAADSGIGSMDLK